MSNMLKVLALSALVGTLSVPALADQDGFSPTHAVPWGCRTVEDIVEIASPVGDEFRQMLGDKIKSGQCFFAPGGVAVQRMEKMTQLPAKGDRPVMVIWSMVDGRGDVAYGSWAPDDES